MARKKKQATPQPRVKGTIELHGRTYRARWMVDGKYYTRSTGTADRDKAEEKLAEFIEPFKLKDEKNTLVLLAQQVEGVTAELKAYEDAKPALALADGFDAYRKSTERPDTGAATLDMYESQYERLATWIAKNYPDAKEMRHVTRAMADGFMAYLLSQNFTANTYNKYATLFRRMWEVLAETARLTANPWAKIKHKTEDKAATRRELTVDELHRVCESVDGELRMLIMTGMYTGQRLGDCALLEWGSVDLTRGWISLVQRKTSRRVMIPIHKVFAGVLAEEPPKQRKGYVMPQMAATYNTDRAALTDRIQAAFKAVGIRTTSKADGQARAMVEVGFHSLRHTFVSIAANAGVPMALIQSIVGHSCPAMTRHYFHENENALKMAVAALPDVTAANALPDGTNAAQAVPCAFCAALDGMTLEQLRAARAEIDKRIAEAEARA